MGLIAAVAMGEMMVLTSVFSLLVRVLSMRSDMRVFSVPYWSSSSQSSSCEGSLED
jgi:hypothetical protein